MSVNWTVCNAWYSKCRCECEGADRRCVHDVDSLEHVVVTDAHSGAFEGVLVDIVLVMRSYA